MALNSRPEVSAKSRNARRDLVINHVACCCTAESRAGRWHGTWRVEKETGTTDVSFASAGRALGAAERSLREYLARTTREANDASRESVRSDQANAGSRLS